MVPRKIEDKNTTITINCAGTCQRVALGAAGIFGVIVAVPIIIGAILLWSRMLFNFFSWLLNSQSPYDAGPGLGTIFGLMLTVGGIIACVVGASCMELRDK